MPLKYLFTAMYEDGSTIEQTLDDRSTIDPEKRSQFYDVLQMEEQKPLVAFALKGDGHEYGVDLRDGHFEIDGVSFRMHEEDELAGFRLVFYRRHTHDFVISKDSQEETRHDVVYRFGWQCTANGKNYQRIMQIK
jgi:hypothetical protein